jgi:hypothetical protein
MRLVFRDKMLWQIDVLENVIQNLGVEMKRSIRRPNFYFHILQESSLPFSEKCILPNQRLPGWIPAFVDDAFSRFQASYSTNVEYGKMFNVSRAGPPAVLPPLSPPTKSLPASTTSTTLQPTPSPSAPTTPRLVSTPTGSDFEAIS